MFGWLKKKGKEKSSPAGPDLSGVDSPVKAEELARRGELHKLYLTPPELKTTGPTCPSRALERRRCRRATDAAA